MYTEIITLGVNTKDGKPYNESSISLGRLHKMSYPELKTMSESLLSFLVEVENRKNQAIHEELRTVEPEFNGQVTN